MTHENNRSSVRTLLRLTVRYGVASLIHFAHNAIFVQDYPNLPAWLTAGGVWAACCGVTARAAAISERFGEIDLIAFGNNLQGHGGCPRNTAAASSRAIAVCI